MARKQHTILIAGASGVAGSSWQFNDRAFAQGRAKPADLVLSGIKLRRHGFADCCDTEDAVHPWLDRMRAARLLPR